MDPITQGAALSAGGSLLGGVMSGASDKKMLKKQIKWQREQMQNRLQWTVNDAKKAGLHPLFALGGGGGFSPASVIPGQSNMGNAVADAAASMGRAIAAPRPTKMQDALSLAQLESVNSQTRRNDAEAALANSQARRIAEESNVRPSVAQTLAGVVSETEGVPAGKITPKAPEVRSRAVGDSARQAGKNPLWQRYQYGPKRGDWIDIPYSDEGPLEEFGPAKAIATFVRWLQNRAKSAPLPRR